MSPKRIAQTELAILLLAIGLFLWWIHPKNTPPEDPFLAMGTSTIALPKFPPTVVEAQSAYVYDASEHKVIYSKNADAIRPLASLTKLMSALTASELIPAYMLVKITGDDIRQEGDTGLYLDEKWPLSKLIDFTLITSSNDGVTALASVAGYQISSTSTNPVQLFVDAMNAKARALGLGSMHFMNQSGLDVSPVVSGGYGSAKDIARLVDYIIQKDPHLLEATSYDKMIISSEDIAHVAENTNKAIGEIPNVIASKTGYTDLSGGNVIVAFNAGLNHPIIISVLGSSYDGRFVDLAALASSTLVYLESLDKGI